MDKQENNDNYSHILKYTGIFGGVQGISILIGVVRNKLVAMLLGPSGMGLLSLFNSTLRLFGDSTNLGIPMSAVREISEAYEGGDVRLLAERICLIRSWCMITALLGAVLCMALSPMLSRWVFSTDDHTLHFFMLSPVIALTAIMGGELAVLKGTRRLKQLAVTSLYNVIGTLVLTVPMYFIWLEKAVVPSIIVIALLQMLVTIRFSYRSYPARFSFRFLFIRKGFSMVKLGVAFVLAGVLSSGEEFLIRLFLTYHGGLESVGIFNAGYMMAITYSGMVFSAMETDYFPRLSAFDHTGPDFNRVVSQQIEVSLLLMAPLLVIFLFSLPVLVPLLYSGKFLPVIDMVRIAILALYLRAVCVPVEYIPLSRGDSRSFLFQESTYDILAVVCVAIGFQMKGFLGCGFGFLVAGVINLVVVWTYARFHFGYRPSGNVLMYMAMQFPIGILACVVSFVSDWRLYVVAGVLLAALSLTVTLVVFHRKTHLWSSFKAKIGRKFHRE